VRKGASLFDGRPRVADPLTQTNGLSCPRAPGMGRSRTIGAVDARVSFDPRATETVRTMTIRQIELGNHPSMLGCRVAVDSTEHKVNSQSPIPCTSYGSGLGSEAPRIVLQTRDLGVRCSNGWVRGRCDPMDRDK
jgi:hypothetical protein